MNLSIVVMGVSGCGKSTLGRVIAETLGLPFIEGDDLHPAQNIRKMESGQPLNDNDRIEFLSNVGDAISAHTETGVVVSCSALKRAYRDTLRSYNSSIRFVMAEISREVLMSRLDKREGHFMPASLLESQLAILERPQDDEAAFFVDGLLPPAEQVTALLEQMKAS